LVTCPNVVVEKALTAPTAARTRSVDWKRLHVCKRHLLFECLIDDRNTPKDVDGVNMNLPASDLRLLRPYQNFGVSPAVF
jgi:hypothetical protein